MEYPLCMRQKDCRHTCEFQFPRQKEKREREEENQSKNPPRKKKEVLEHRRETGYM
jgi:hypothetical protein